MPQTCSAGPHFRITSRPSFSGRPCAELVGRHSLLFDLRITPAACQHPHWFTLLPSAVTTASQRQPIRPAHRPARPLTSKPHLVPVPHSWGRSPHFVVRLRSCRLFISVQPKLHFMSLARACGFQLLAGRPLECVPLASPSPEQMLFPGSPHPSECCNAHVPRSCDN